MDRSDACSRYYREKKKTLLATTVCVHSSTNEGDIFSFKIKPPGVICGTPHVYPTAVWESILYLYLRWSGNFSIIYFMPDLKLLKQQFRSGFFLPLVACAKKMIFACIYGRLYCASSATKAVHMNSHEQQLPKARSDCGCLQFIRPGRSTRAKSHAP